jgi:hypothetical protein
MPLSAPAYRRLRRPGRLACLWLCCWISYHGLEGGPKWRTA